MKGLSKESKDHKYLISDPLWIIGACFMVALTFVCFMGPVWDRFDKWMDSSIVHGLYVFMGAIVIIFLFSAWIRFRK